MTGRGQAADSRAAKGDENTAAWDLYYSFLREGGCGRQKDIKWTSVDDWNVTYLEEMLTHGVRKRLCKRRLAFAAQQDERYLTTTHSRRASDAAHNSSFQRDEEGFHKSGRLSQQR